MATTVLFDTLSEELLVAVLSQLESRDLRRAALAHPRIGLLRCCVVAVPTPRVTRMSVVERELDMPPPPCGCKCATSTHLRWTLVQAAAWLRIQAHSTEEQAWLPRMPLLGSQRGRQCGHRSRCWLWALGELEALKRPLQFSQFHEQVNVMSTNAVSVVEKVPRSPDMGDPVHPSWGAAVGSTVMRAGQHYCEFTWVGGDGVMLGVVTDSSAARQRVSATISADGELWLTPCTYFFSAAEGERVHWGDDFSWAGKRGANVGDRIGLLVDCDRMTLAVYINDDRLGVMVPWNLQAGPMEPSWHGSNDGNNGRDGPWCAMGVRWAVELVDGSSIRAQMKPTPMITAAQLAEEEKLAHEWLVAQSDRPPAADILSSDEQELDEGSDEYDEGHANEDNGDQL